MVNFYKPQKAKVKATAPLILEIDSLDLNGAGIGRHQGKPVFIEGCLPGERVKVKLTEQKSKYARGQLLAIEQTSEQRVEPACRHFKNCGGCDLQHMAIGEQLAFKQGKVAELFSRNADVNELPWQDAITAEPLGYRRKARLGVQYHKNNEVVIGFRQKRSKQLTSIRQCPVLTPELERLIKPLSELIKSLASNVIGHVDLIAQSQPLAPLVQFRVLKPLSDKVLAQLGAFEEQHAVIISLLTDNGARSLTQDCDTALSYQLNFEQSHFNFAFDSRDFIQVNAKINEAMVTTALNWLSIAQDDVVLDLFSGLGNFSLPAATMASKVIGIEGVQAMVDKASANARLNHISNCQFFQADLNADWSKQPWLEQLQQVNKVILDPARAGAFEAVSQFHLIEANRIVYVSCDPATLARDSKVLIEQGYALTKICLMDMFAQTRHIETMACFDKA